MVSAGHLERVTFGLIWVGNMILLIPQRRKACMVTFMMRGLLHLCTLANLLPSLLHAHVLSC